MTTSPDIKFIDEQYLARENLALEILNQAKKKAGFELIHQFEQTESVRLANLAVQLPPMYMPTLLKKLAMTEGQFLKTISPVFADIIRGRITNEKLTRLSEACNRLNRCTREVAIDISDKRPIGPFRVVFANNPEALQQVHDQGQSQAVLQVLKYVEGRVPLLRYKSGLAGDKIKLKVGYRGNVGSLPTKLPNVDLRLFYPTGIQLPQLSFVVRPFELI